MAACVSALLGEEAPSEGQLPGTPQTREGGFGGFGGVGLGDLGLAGGSGEGWWEVT